MSWRTLLYLIPYFISLIMSLGVGIYTLRRRSVAGAAPFAFVAMSQAAWTLGFIFELISPGLEAKIFWDNVQFVPPVVWFIAFLAFALQYTGRRLKKPKLTWALLSIIPFLFVILAFTDKSHHLIRSAVRFVPGEPFPALIYDFTSAFWICGIYGYLLMITGIALLVNRLIRPHNLFRAQIGIIIIGAFIPLIGTVLTLAGIQFTFHRDTTPFTFALSNLIIAWGLFRYRLFDIVPVARDTVIESMNDPVLVIDASNHLVDLNQAAQLLIGKKTREIMGKPVEKVLSKWPDLVERFKDFGETLTEIVLNTEQGRHHFDLSLFRLLDSRRRITGHCVVAHDITRLKQAEEEIKSRTRQLEKTNQELRAAQEKLIQQERMATLGRLIAVVSHELRNPLGTVSNSLFSIKDSLTDCRNERIDRALKLAERNIERCDQIIEELLDYTRKRDLHPVSTNLDKWLNDLLDEQEFPEGIDTLRRLKSGVTLKFDREHLRYAVINVVTNAVQALEEEKTAKKRLTVESAVNEERLEILFIDTGPGIPVDLQEKVFEPLFSTRGAGVGLGLPIVRKIMREQDGDVELESQPGRGTTVTLWLPLGEPI